MHLASHFGQMKAIRCSKMFSDEEYTCTYNEIYNLHRPICFDHARGEYPLRYLFFKVKFLMSSSGIKLYIPQLRPRYIYQERKGNIMYSTFVRMHARNNEIQPDGEISYLSRIK